MTSWYIEKATKSSAPVLVDLWSQIDFSISVLLFVSCAFISLAVRAPSIPNKSCSHDHMGHASESSSKCLTHCRGLISLVTPPLIDIPCQILLIIS